MSTQPDPKHVEFALEQYAKAEKLIIENIEVVNGEGYIHTLDQTIVMTIDLDFCNSLPIGDEPKFLLALAMETIGRVDFAIDENDYPVVDPDEYLLLIRCDVDQFLTAYQESQGGKG